MFAGNRNSSVPLFHCRMPESAKVCRRNLTSSAARRVYRTERPSKIDNVRAWAREQSNDSARVTIFLGCGFAAKYREGGGVFSVRQMRC